MRASAIKGFSFGLTSGIITTLGMMVGLHSFTGSRLIVLGGIISIALADSFSDALGIHMSEESDKKKSSKEVWMSTLTTFLSKIFFSGSFIIPVILFSLTTAIYVGIVYGLILLSFLSYFIARKNKDRAAHVILEHLVIAVVVILATHFVGDLISAAFAGASQKV